MDFVRGNCGRDKKTAFPDVSALVGKDTWAGDHFYLPQSERSSGKDEVIAHAIPHIDGRWDRWIPS